MKIGDRVQLKMLHQPTGTIIGIEDGLLMNDVILVAERFAVQWDDGETGKVAANDVWQILPATELAASLDPASPPENYTFSVLWNSEIVTISFNDGKPHYIADTDCEVGWCDGGRSYPKPCECGGLIHAEFGDENYEGDYYLVTQCDRCGKPERH